jgi:hypothetical protein
MIRNGQTIAGSRVLAMGLTLVEQPQPGTYNALVIAVAHKQYTCLSEGDFRTLLQPGAVAWSLMRWQRHGVKLV